MVIHAKTPFYAFLGVFAAAVAMLVVVAGCPRAKADDAADRQRRALAAWHMTAPVVAADASKCDCEAGTRGTFQEQFPKMLRDRRVMVAFFGAEPRCCHGTLIGLASQVPAGYNPARPIVVYYPVDGFRVAVSETLPADASNADLVRAVKAAQAKMAPKPK